MDDEKVNLYQTDRDKYPGYIEKYVRNPCSSVTVKQGIIPKNPLSNGEQSITEDMAHIQNTHQKIFIWHC